MTLSDFRQIFIRPHLTNYLGVMITTSRGEGGAAENQFWTDQVIWTSSDFKATFKGNLEEH
jgi:hypothetical protein